jgi:phosphoribosylaminoimidazole carboxylase
MSELQVGIIGGGQLGRMLADSANKLDIRVKILDREHSPAKQVVNHSGQ